jgi:hypothetical protein
MALVTDADSASQAECDRYRAMASDIRARIPTLKDPEAAEDLRLLAVRYERLAEYTRPPQEA